VPERVRVMVDPVLIEPEPNGTHLWRESADGRSVEVGLTPA
jgi:hypothetical protein